MNWFRSNAFAAQWWTGYWLAGTDGAPPPAVAAPRSRPMAVYPGSLMSRM